jgi:hypothetical protein
MEETIFHHLLDKIVHIFRSDLIEIISIRQKICPVIDRKAVNIRGKEQAPSQMPHLYSSSQIPPYWLPL